MAERVSYCGGTVTGLKKDGSADGQPLVVMIPGGGSQAVYFDVPGRSYLEIAARNGFSAVALNRPGQADSKPLDLDPASDTGAFSANADALLEAVDEIWTGKRHEHPGVVIYGSSIGGAISLHMAAKWTDTPRAWPLLGVTVADIGQAPPHNVTDTWRSLPLSDTIDLFEYGSVFFAKVPKWTLMPPPASRDGAPELLIPRAELQEVVGGWPREWKLIVSRIGVPIQYILAEHDLVWEVSHSLIDEFAAALSTRSPFVDARMMPDTSHGIGMGTLAVSHIYDALSFIERCGTINRHPEMIGRHVDTE